MESINIVFTIQGFVSIKKTSSTFPTDLQENTNNTQVTNIKKPTKKLFINLFL